MHALTLLLVPLMTGLALYSLVHYRHAGWWSWLISSLADFVYMVQFVLMTPQLFVNYKLKSVAHLPWRALSYKAFNTFIDDVFAWAIAMQRRIDIADDLVSLSCYQRHIYPVDKSRTNEFGRAYAEEPLLLDQTRGDRDDAAPSEHAGGRLSGPAGDTAQGGADKAKAE